MVRRALQYLPRRSRSSTHCPQNLPGSHVRGCMSFLFLVFQTNRNDRRSEAAQDVILGTVVLNQDTMRKRLCHRSFVVEVVVVKPRIWPCHLALVVASACPTDQVVEVVPESAVAPTSFLHCEKMHLGCKHSVACFNCAQYHELIAQIQEGHKSVARDKTLLFRSPSCWRAWQPCLGKLM